MKRSKAWGQERTGARAHRVVADAAARDSLVGLREAHRQHLPEEDWLAMGERGLAVVDDPSELSRASREWLRAYEESICFVAGAPAKMATLLLRAGMHLPCCRNVRGTGSAPALNERESDLAANHVRLSRDEQLLILARALLGGRRALADEWYLNVSTVRRRLQVLEARICTARGLKNNDQVPTGRACTSRVACRKVSLR
jgi:hypothetical protein